MAPDLATVGQGIKQLRASQEQMAPGNANVAEQFKASQERLARVVAQVSDQNARPSGSARATANCRPTPRPVPALSSPRSTAQP
jgi:hypothetical protein